MYKILVLCAALAVAKAGLISAPAPISYATPAISYGSHAPYPAAGLTISKAPTAVSYSYQNQAIYRTAPTLPYAPHPTSILTYAHNPEIYSHGPPVSYGSPRIAFGPTIATYQGPGFNLGGPAISFRGLPSFPGPVVQYGGPGFKLGPTYGRNYGW